LLKPISIDVLTSKIKPLAVAAGLGLLISGGYALHNTTDWALVGTPPVNPSVVWGKCLLKDKPTALEGSKPGIEPRSKLYYHPAVRKADQGKELVGWVFYGHIQKDGGVVNFRCETDLTGDSVLWVTGG